MAYGNWGAFVHRNGERMRSHEDQTPYQEEDTPPGYWQAFGRSESINPHHAVLGSGRVRLCGYKHYPVLFLDGVRVELGDEGDGAGDIEGFHYEFYQTEEPAGVELKLTEPDGTVWESHCGYGIGAGFEDA